MNVSLKAEWEVFLQTQLASGDYDTASEVVRAGLRLLKHETEARQAKIAAFRAAIAEGVEQVRRGELHDSTSVINGLLDAIDQKAAVRKMEDFADV